MVIDMVHAHNTISQVCYVTVGPVQPPPPSSTCCLTDHHTVGVAWEAGRAGSGPLSPPTLSLHIRCIKKYSQLVDVVRYVKGDDRWKDFPHRSEVMLGLRYPGH